MIPTTKQKIFFPNLDGLRFFSFLLVFFAHSFNVESLELKATWWYKLFKERMFQDGDIGVSFFFVLSGFLITYLLLKEKEFTSKIDVKSFYIRRALRIWPLYYLVLLVGFLIFPMLKQFMGLVPNETANPWLCFTFLNNFDRILHVPDAFVIAVLWSVAIEEQFYLVWPVLFYFIPSKYTLYLIAAVILSSTLFRYFYMHKVPIELHTFGVISDMAVGGGMAYLAIFSDKFNRMIKVSPKWLTLFFYLLFLSIILFKQEMFQSDWMIVFKRLVMGITFAYIIAEQNFSENSFFKVGNWKKISTLGKYTYGLYCLHPMAILAVTIVLSKLSLNQSAWQIWLLQLPLSFALSILISWISFTYIESWFLKLKEKFAYISKS